MRILRLDGELYRTVDFGPAAADLAMWRAEFAELVGAAPGMAGGKLWVADLQRAGPGRAVLTIAPEHILQRGYQLWVIDADDGLVARYHYGRPHVGFNMAGYPEIHALDRADGGVYRFRLP